MTRGQNNVHFNYALRQFPLSISAKNEQVIQERKKHSQIGIRIATSFNCTLRQRQLVTQSGFHKEIKQRTIKSHGSQLVSESPIAAIAPQLRRLYGSIVSHTVYLYSSKLRQIYFEPLWENSKDRQTGQLAPDKICWSILVHCTFTGRLQRAIYSDYGEMCLQKMVKISTL